MISITIIDGNESVEIHDSSITINNRLLDNIKELCHEYILRIIRITDSWKKQDLLMDEFDNWEVIIKMDSEIRKYSSKEYSNYDFDTIREVIDELVSRCI